MEKIKILDLNFAEEHNLEEINDYSEELKQQLDNSNTPYEIGYICSDCGEFATGTIAVETSRGDTRQVCEDCITNSEVYFCCEDCETWYDDTVNSYTTSDGRTICDGCRCEHYIECDNCGDLVYEDNAYYCDDCDRYYCESCWDNHYHEENLLYDYHAFRDWRPYKTETECEPPFYIGHELEIDNGSLCEDVINDITSSIPAVCMHDGSLGCDGIEIVSQPLSYKYYLAKENDYHELFKRLANDYGYQSHNTTTCGLHFHVTRPQNSDIIDRIILFMETYKEEIIRLSRRSSGEISDWCNFLSDYRTSVSEKEIKSLDYIKKNKETSTRYMALNLTNSNTIEFRIFKGTLKYETFMADLEFVNNLVTIASDLSIPVEEMTWNKITSMGCFLPQYIDEHDLHSNKPIVDYTTEIIIERNRRLSKTKKELRTLYKTLMSEINKLTTVNTKRFNSNKMVNIEKLTSYTTFLECVVRDLRYIDRDNYMDYIDGITTRINNIKGRMI